LGIKPIKLTEDLDVKADNNTWIIMANAKKLRRHNKDEDVLKLE
jgi:hypothetical protein